MVARQDAISLPIVWEGKSENYATGIALDGALGVGLTLEVSDRMFCVSVVVMEEGADGPHAGELEQLCMEMNASLPSACFLLSERGGAYVVSEPRSPRLPPAVRHLRA